MLEFQIRDYLYLFLIAAASGVPYPGHSPSSPSTMASPWTVNDIPADFLGKTVFITGATSGIGFEAARVFASRKYKLPIRLVVACDAYQGLRNKEFDLFMVLLHL